MFDSAFVKTLLVLALGAGCASGKRTQYDYGSEGSALFTEMCAVCHGEVGEGGIGPTLMDTPKAKATLAETIEGSMPTSDPTRCQGECAELIADFIVNGLTSSALTCDRVAPSKRRLRLLTRREYRQTVADLFGAPATATCSGHLDCPFEQACDQSSCRATGCDEHQFVFGGGGQDVSAVHVAGSFNNWAATVSDGGLALQRQGSLWAGRFTLPMGPSEYKFVITRSTGADWIADPRSPSFADDGFGGQNSIVTPSCRSDDVTAAIPLESRPEGFPFDNDATSAIVTTPHLDAYLSVARSLADQAVENLDERIGCDAMNAECADEILDVLGPRIFRRPLTKTERARSLEVAKASDNSADGARDLITSLLISVHFLYRSELGEEFGDHYRLTPYEIASGLSYMFWGTMPDDELFAAAASGELDDAAGIEKHARRLLQSPRSRSMVGLFALQWLGAESIETAAKATGLGFAEDLRGAMLAETRNFVSHVVFDSSGRFGELLEAQFTIASPELASFYGLVAPVDGMVPYAGSRAGVLGHGSVLGSHAHSDQTSPIRRGLFVRSRLLCQELPPPPPNAGGVPEIDPNATTRERFAQHTDNPACSSCHQYIDGVGFGFERFDPVGRYRETENGQAIDSSGSLTGLSRLGADDVSSFSSLPELAALVSESDSARSCFVRQTVRFARGHRETLEDRCARLDLEEKFAASGYDIGELLIRIATSRDFMERK